MNQDDSFDENALPVAQKPKTMVKSVSKAVEKDPTVVVKALRKWLNPNPDNDSGES